MVFILKHISTTTPMFQEHTGWAAQNAVIDCQGMVQENAENVRPNNSSDFSSLDSYIPLHYEQA